MRDDDARLTIGADTAGECAILTARGLLDGRTYHALRDRIVKAALDEPRGVLVDVTGLRAPADSAWAVLTSARWLVNRWPDVPILAVCADAATRSAIRRNGITRYVPMYPHVDGALADLQTSLPPARRRARAVLHPRPTSLHRSRRFVEDQLTDWALPTSVPVVKVVVTTLVANVLDHTDSAPDLRLETDGEVVAVAVSDDSHDPAALLETRRHGLVPSGLTIVAALSRTWGNSPTPSGKTVWAMIGPENRL